LITTLRIFIDTGRGLHYDTIDGRLWKKRGVFDMNLKSSHCNRLEQANQVVGAAAAAVSEDSHRLAYHIMGPAGWINDPNGLIQYKGEYHVFYQYHPYSSEWGPMHWGHVKSRDLVHWEHLPVALAPGDEYDSDGCFSGSAVEAAGVLTLIYTGNIDGENKRQVQNVAMSTDGIIFRKQEGNPVVSTWPAEGSRDFRDPKVWGYGDHWYMVVGTAKEEVGKVLLYSSIDLVNWDYIGVAAESNGTQGWMWECPDLFPLENRHVLITSPMGMEGHKNIYIVGDMNYKTGKFNQQFCEELDFGPDFYAAQTFLDDQGRRILIAWMDMWGAKMPSKVKGWAGSMTLPRVLTFFPDGSLCMQPVPELASLRGEQLHQEHLRITDEGENDLGGFQGDCLEIVAEFRLEAGCAEEFGFRLRCAEDRSEETLVLYNRNSGELLVDRSKSGSGDGGLRGSIIKGMGDTLKLHIYLDRSSVEVFANDGRLAISSRIYPKPESLRLGLFARYGSIELVSLNIWRLEDIWKSQS
jgi:beta-fructofuranosidase